MTWSRKWKESQEEQFREVEEICEGARGEKPDYSREA